MTAWAHLPNARHIDAVLAHAEAHPERWDAARDAARGAAWVAARDAAWAADRGVAWFATLDAVWGATRNAVRCACSALVAWDDAGLIMDMPVDAVRTLAAVGHHPAVLILPARLVMEETP